MIFIVKMKPSVFNNFTSSLKGIASGQNGLIGPNASEDAPAKAYVSAQEAR